MMGHSDRSRQQGASEVSGKQKIYSKMSHLNVAEKNVVLGIVQKLREIETGVQSNAIMPIEEADLKIFFAKLFNNWDSSQKASDRLHLRARSDQEARIPVGVFNQDTPLPPPSTDKATAENHQLASSCREKGSTIFLALELHDDNDPIPMEFTFQDAAGIPIGSRFVRLDLGFKTLDEAKAHLIIHYDRCERFRVMAYNNALAISFARAYIKSLGNQIMIESARALIKTYYHRFQALDLASDRHEQERRHHEAVADCMTQMAR